MKLRYHRLDVFTERPFGGNPLAVFPQAPELPDALIQTIAQEPRPDADLAWRIEQGFEMGRPSLIDVEVDKRGGRSAAPRVSGSAVLIGLGELDI
jgi:predicted PhzF superfamily epimerase YddE/YHI9